MYSLVIGVLQQLQDDTLNVLAHIAGLSQRRTIANGKRHIQALGDRLRQQRLAGSRRSQHQQIALLQLQLVRLLVQQLGSRDLVCRRRRCSRMTRRRVLRNRRSRQLGRLRRHYCVANAGNVQQIGTIGAQHRLGLRRRRIGRLRYIVVDALVVIVHGDGQHLFGQFLADDVRVQVFHDLLWRRRLFAAVLRLLLDRLLRVHFAEDDEKVMAFLAFHEARGADKGLDVRARITAFRARQCIFVLAGWFFAAVRGFLAAAAGCASGRRWRWGSGARAGGGGRRRSRWWRVFVRITGEC